MSTGAGPRTRSWGVRPAGGSRALLEAPASHAEWLADAATVFPVNGVSADEQ